MQSVTCQAVPLSALCWAFVQTYSRVSPMRRLHNARPKRNEQHESLPKCRNCVANEARTCEASAWVWPRWSWLSWL